MKGKVKPIPEGFHTATPRIYVRGAAKAIEFYKQAFSATELERFTDPSGKIVIDGDQDRRFNSLAVRGVTRNA